MDECKTPIPIWEFAHQPDEKTLSAWAKHFRENYISEEELDAMRNNLSREEYLTQFKFPTSGRGFGPATRAGDFGEILVADYLQYALEYKVPRERYKGKWITDESTKGTDVLAYKIHESDSRKDELVAYEVKANFSRKANPSEERLQNAIDDSAKDELRLGFSLNALKRIAYVEQDAERFKIYQRFQNLTDSPCVRKYGAVLTVCDSSFGQKTVTGASTKKHPSKALLSVIVIRGKDMMDLTNNLYARAAAEA